MSLTDLSGSPGKNRLHFRPLVVDVKLLHPERTPAGSPVGNASQKGLRTMDCKTVIAGRARGTTVASLALFLIVGSATTRAGD